MYHILLMCSCVLITFPYIYILVAMLNVQNVVGGYNSYRNHWSTAVGDEFELAMEELNRHYKLQPHVHTATQQLPNKTYVEMIVTHRYSPPKKGGITLLYSPLIML